VLFCPRMVLGRARANGDAGAPVNCYSPSNLKEGQRQQFQEWAKETYQKQPWRLDDVPSEWFLDDVFYSVICQVQVWPPMQPGQTQFSGAQKEWVWKVKKELSKNKCSKALRDSEEATMEAEMVRIWDQEETWTPKKPRTNASYAACYNPPPSE